MRTTLDIDDELLQWAIAQFPRGTPKRVILEEALRRLVGVPHGANARPDLDPRLERLVAEGRLRPRSGSVAPPAGVGSKPLAEVLADLESDRAER